jgi:glycosyltransferase involved in cell wall biosynthesis
MRKILFIAYYFPPIGGSGVQRALKFAKYLPDEGFLPVVVASRASVKDNWAPQDPSLIASIPSDVCVSYVEAYPPDPRRKLRERLSRWLALPDPYSKWWEKSASEIAIKTGSDARLVLATMSPYASANVGNEVSRRLNIPWVADLRDPWALDDIELYPSYAHRRLDMLRMEKSLSTASLIIMNTPQAARDLQETFPSFRSKKVVSIPNGFDREDFKAPAAPRTDGKFRIVHSGSMFTTAGFQLRRRRFYRLLGGVERGVDILTRSPIFFLEALARWSKKVPRSADDVEVLFVGQLTGDDRGAIEQSEIRELVRYTGYVSHAENLALVRTADLLFLPMHSLPRGRRCRSLPGKTFECMASGRPILAAVPDGDARDFLSQCGTALLCRPDDVEGMVQQLATAYNAWKSGTAIGPWNKDFVEQFERRRLTAKLAEAFRDLL